MKNLIVEEVNSFRLMVRSQARAAQAAKRQDTYVPHHLHPVVLILNRPLTQPTNPIPRRDHLIPNPRARPRKRHDFILHSRHPSANRVSSYGRSIPRSREGTREGSTAEQPWTRRGRRCLDLILLLLLFFGDHLYGASSFFLKFSFLCSFRDVFFFCFCIL
jgi:hypothetical protein